MGWWRLPLQYLTAGVMTAFCAPVILWRSLRGRRRAAYEPVRWWCQAMLGVAGVGSRVEGAGNLPPDGRCVLVANHCSHLDGPVLICSLPLPIYFVIKSELARVPVWGPATLRVGFIAVDRRDSTQARLELGRAVEAIRGGRTVLVFPEGTRSPDGRLHRFKKGGFHLAVDAGVPVVPVSVNRSADLLPKSAWWSHSGTVEVIVHPPVETATLDRDDVPSLTETVRHVIDAGRRHDPAYPGLADALAHQS